MIIRTESLMKRSAFIFLNRTNERVLAEKFFRTEEEKEWALAFEDCD